MAAVDVDVVGFCLCGFTADATKIHTTAIAILSNEKANHTNKRKPNIFIEKRIQKQKEDWESLLLT